MKKICIFLLVFSQLLLLVACMPGKDAQVVDIIDVQKEEIEQDWGITLTTTDITPIGLTIVCEQINGEQQGRLQTGSPYWVQIYRDNAWQDIAYVPQQYYVAWTSEAWIITENDIVEWAVEWQWLYGQLSKGEYRIGKSVMDFLDTGEYHEQIYYATFEIE